jgi:DNA-directed RNA polymerase subunit alpha
VVAEPLERGFGMTLGNSPAPCAAVFAAGRCRDRGQIDGVLHEFSSIPGVREDVTDIILNIKEIAFRMEATKAPSAWLCASRAPVWSPQATSRPWRHRDPQPRACSARSTKALKSAWNSPSTPARAMFLPTATAPEDAPIGLIPVDSLYSPVKKCVLQGGKHP